MLKDNYSCNTMEEFCCAPISVARPKTKYIAKVNQGTNYLQLQCTAINHIYICKLKWQLYKRNIWPEQKWKLQEISVFIVFQSFRFITSSSAHFPQPVVGLGVGDDGLNSDDGFIDLGLQLPQFLNVQQAQDLSCFV